MYHITTGSVSWKICFYIWVQRVSGIWYTGHCDMSQLNSPQGSKWCCTILNTALGLQHCSFFHDVPAAGWVFPPDVICTQPNNHWQLCYFNTFQFYFTTLGERQERDIWCHEKQQCRDKSNKVVLMTLLKQYFDHNNRNKMANSAKRALANTTVLDSPSNSSASPVLLVSPNCLCVNKFPKFMHFHDSSDLPVRYSGNAAEIKNI